MSQKRNTIGSRPDRHNLSRRSFLKGAAALTVTPLIMPSSALGLGGHTAPSDRVTVAHIGVGSWGFGTHVTQDCERDDIEILAVCDVIRDRQGRARKKVQDAYAQRKRVSQYGGVKMYTDFRQILDRPDVDAVVVAPLHYWHTVMAIMAAQAGKHVYVEKMAATTLGEARALATAVKRHGIVLQHGPQGRSGAFFRHATDLIRSGRIGKVLRVEASCINNNKVTPGPSDRPFGTYIVPGKELPVPDGFDWDLCVGPAIDQPYVGNMYIAEAFGFGALADFGSHTVDSAQMVLGMDDTGPVEVCPGGINGREVVTCTYANGVELMAFARQDDPDLGDFGIRVTGTEGVVVVDRGRCLVRPAHLDRKPVGPDEWHYSPNVAEPVIRASSHVVAANTRGTVANEDSWAGVGAHKANWFHCIRTGQKANGNEDCAHRSSSVCVLIDMANCLRRSLKWDPQKQEFIGDEEANRLRDYPKRAPWQVY
ncbi:MAG: Gfo/Idh/MocA family oxidoreductase [Thermoguttaceae bacterium]